MIKKWKTVLELTGNDWSWDLIFITDITTHLNVLNLKLQGPSEFIFETHNSVKAFETKFKLFVNQIARSDLSHLENCPWFKNGNKLLCLKNRFVKIP